MRMCMVSIFIFKIYVYGKLCILNIVKYFHIAKIYYNNL